MGRNRVGEGVQEPGDKRDLTLTLFVVGVVGSSGLGLTAFMMVVLAMVGDPLELRAQVDRLSGPLFGYAQPQFSTHPPDLPAYPVEVADLRLADDAREPGRDSGVETLPLRGGRGRPLGVELEPRPAREGSTGFTRALQAAPAAPAAPPPNSRPLQVDPASSTYVHRLSPAVSASWAGSSAPSLAAIGAPVLSGAPLRSVSGGLPSAQSGQGTGAPPVASRPVTTASIQALDRRSPDQESSLEAAFQVQVTRLLKRHLSRAGLSEGSLVVLRPATGQVLALAALPGGETPPANLQGLALRRYPPGSTFKLVTALASLREHPGHARNTFRCHTLEGGRVGVRLASLGRNIRDDEKQRRPHGDVDLETGIALSCNAYFAQLAVKGVQPASLLETASLFGIEMARPNTVDELKKTLEQAAFGQGEVLASPLEMAQVAATVANGGVHVPPRLGPGDVTGVRRALVSASEAALVARGMRRAVVQGTAKVLSRSRYPAIAGKTGTAEVEGETSHAWFIGFAPYLETVYGMPYPASRQIAFAVVIPGAGYGAETAAPLAGEIAAAARDAGLID